MYSDEGTRWAGVVVAAGEARRMGRFKPLLPFGAHRVLEQVLWVARQGGLDPLVAVLGHRAEELAAHLPDDVLRVDNPDYRAGGMFLSVRCGVSALPAGVAAVAILLGDQPTLTPEVLMGLQDAWRQDGVPGDRCYLPTCAGRRGHPLCVPGPLLPELLAWRGERGLRGWLENAPFQIREVPVEEPGILMDMDTPADYRRALEWLRRRTGHHEW